MATQQPILVSHLIDPDLHCWKAYLINELFDSPSAQAILTIPIPIRPTPDKLIWTLNPKGIFSVKSFSRVLSSHINTQDSSTVAWKKRWNLKAPETIKMFLWRLGVNALPTRENLLKRVDIHDPTCLLCQGCIESPCHLFLRCPIAKALWFSACWGFRAKDVRADSPEDIVNLVIKPPDALCRVADQWKVSLVMALTLEEIWMMRNTELHLKSKVDLRASTQLIQRRFREYVVVCSASLTSSAHISPHHWTPLLLAGLKLT